MSPVPARDATVAIPRAHAKVAVPRNLHSHQAATYPGKRQFRPSSALCQQGFPDGPCVLPQAPLITFLVGTPKSCQDLGWGLQRLLQADLPSGPCCGAHVEPSQHVDLHKVLSHDDSPAWPPA